MLRRTGGLSPSNAIVRYYCIYPSCVKVPRVPALHDDFDRINFHTDILQNIVDHVNVSHMGEQYKCPFCESFWWRTVKFIDHLRVNHNVTVAIPDGGKSVLEPDTSQLTKRRAHLFFQTYVKQRQLPPADETMARYPVLSPQNFDRNSLAFGSIQRNPNTDSASWVPTASNVELPGRLRTDQESYASVAAGSSASTSRPASIWSASGPLHPNHPLYCRNTYTSFFPHRRPGNERWVEAEATSRNMQAEEAAAAATGTSRSLGNLNIGHPQLPNTNTDFGSLTDLPRRYGRGGTVGATERGSADPEDVTHEIFDRNSPN